MYVSYYGTFTEAWKQDPNAVTDPFDVLENMHEIMYFGWQFTWAREHCTDEHVIDWGSWVWKCSGRELMELNRSENEGKVSECIDPDKIYGFLIVEVY